MQCYNPFRRYFIIKFQIQIQNLFTKSQYILHIQNIIDWWADQKQSTARLKNKVPVKFGILDIHTMKGFYSRTKFINCNLKGHVMIFDPI